MRYGLAAVVVLAVALAACGGPSLRAHAGEDFTVGEGQQPIFDGCASTGRIVNYKWTIVSAPVGEMAGDAGKVIRDTDANCSFTLEEGMSLKHLGVWEIQLEVRDAAGVSSTDTVLVTVQ